LIVVFIPYQWSASYSLDIGAIKADDKTYAFSVLPVLGLALPSGARWSLVHLALTLILLANMCLHDAALLDMLGLLEHERLLDPIKYLNALVNLGVLVYWAGVLSAGWRSGQVVVSRSYQEDGTA